MTTKTKERPILFSAPMMRAILDGRKTQTRRVCKLANKLDENYRRRRVVSRPNGITNISGKVGYWEYQGLLNDAPDFPSCKEERYLFVENFILWCPYGAPGDRLWVREVWSHHYSGLDRLGYHYRADLPENRNEAMTANHAFGLMQWKSPIHMPRKASRLTLEIQEVRVERVQEISGDDLAAEGFPPDNSPPHDGTRLTEHGRRLCFAEYWDRLNGKGDKLDGPGSWEANPWCWVIAFKVIA